VSPSLPKSRHVSLEKQVRAKSSQLRKAFRLLKEQAALLDSAHDAILIVGLDGTIRYWNRGAERLYGWKKKQALGASADQLLHTEPAQEMEEVRTNVLRGKRWEGDLVQRRRDGSPLTVLSRWSLCRDAMGYPSGVLQISSDITGHRRAERQLRRLSSYLLRLQDEERRRIARELHDSVGQLLAALEMNLSRFEPTNSQPAKLLADCTNLTREASRQLRSLSYLLHPPLLDEAGLVAALNWYVNGFSERSGIAVDLEADAELSKLPQELQVTIFRIVQECLTNVHRHSGSQTARIRVRYSPLKVKVVVEDSGCGVPRELTRTNGDAAPVPGVGILGMRERVRQFGGKLAVTNLPQGTRVEATVPLPRERRSN
jgi:PAS domain S-box-containing protein